MILMEVHMLHEQTETAEKSTIGKLERMRDLTLGDFCLRLWTEVFEIDAEGARTSAVGCFMNESIAAIYVSRQENPERFKLRKIWAIAKGTIGFVLTGENAVLIENEKMSEDLTAMTASVPTEEDREPIGIAE